MIRPYRLYTDQEKLAAVREIKKCKSVPAVARASGICTPSLYRWLEELGSPVGGEAGTSVVKPLKRFDQDFKRTAVGAVRAGRKVPDVAKQLGIARETLYTWCRRIPIEETSAGGKGWETIEKMQAALRKEERKRKRDEVRRRKDETDQSARVREMIADPLVWMQKYTETKDSHWREHGAKSPYRPFPDKPYFRPVVEWFKEEPVIFMEKSRNMMMSWLFVGLFTHVAMTTPGIEVLFQSQKEEKAFELVDYAKILYERQKPELQEAFPLARSMRRMADGELEFAHGSRIIGIPGGGDQIRSYHPWGLFMDEAAFMPEAGESYDHAVPVCQKIIVISSAGPGWFADFVTNSE